MCVMCPYQRCKYVPGPSPQEDLVGTNISGSFNNRMESGNQCLLPCHSFSLARPEPGSPSRLCKKSGGP